MKKCMIIGPRGSGKTRIASFLEGADLPDQVTQDVIYRKRTIDVPASYLENTWMYPHIIAIAQNHAACIIALRNNKPSMPLYSPGFTQVFNVPVFGAITYWDASEERNPFCYEELKTAGIKDPIAFVNLKSGEGFEDIAHCVIALLEEG